jgi:hypothetical protein
MPEQLQACQGLQPEECPACDLPLPTPVKTNSLEWLDLPQKGRIEPPSLAQL